MSLVEKQVEGVKELVEQILEIGADLPSRRPLWFRGLPCSDYSLTSRLAREASSEAEMFDREQRLLTRFRQRSLPFWPGGYPQDDWEHLFVMQHHGVPTRLLDWSENVFVALFFAIPSDMQRQSDHKDAHPGVKCKPTLWCLDPIGWNQNIPHLHDLDVNVLTTNSTLLQAYMPATLDPNRTAMRHSAPVAIYGAHNSARIVAQRGTFTIAGKGLDPLEQYANSSIGDTTTLWRFVFELDHTTLKSQLTHLGFTESMVFPDLPALARELTESEE